MHDKTEQARQLVEEARSAILHVRAGRQADPHLVQAIEKLAEAMAMMVAGKQTTHGVLPLDEGN